MKNVYIGKKSITGKGLAICRVIDSDIATGDTIVYNRETGKIFDSQSTPSFLFFALKVVNLALHSAFIWTCDHHYILHSGCIIF